MSDKATLLATELGQLTAKYIHDIRTPLASITLKAKLSCALLTPSAEHQPLREHEKSLVEALQTIEALGVSINQRTTAFWDDLGPLLQHDLEPHSDTASRLSVGLDVEATAFPQGQTIRVLLIEDNEINQEVALSMLNQLDCEVVSAIKGSQALSLLAAQSYDLILADYWLPDMNGSELTRQIRALPGGQDVPIVGLTASPSREDHAKAVAAGMNICVTKPITLKLLKKLLENYCQQPLAE
ncbi:MAG: response regulator [Cellvibrionaceae bacterium]|nr:response regulator [Cellvibrionaceae bacterium]